MYDVFFLSYGEPTAQVAFADLKRLCPIAREVSGITGIQSAHAHCAALSRTKHFFIVDADNQIDDERVLSYRVSDYDAAYVHLWYARNPVNGLAYGWGGLKLFPRGVFDDAPEMVLDMTTAFPLKVIPDVVSTTHFNTSPFTTWRSAFRETVKLATANQSEESRERLHVWCTVGSGAYADLCLRGAREGRAYAAEHTGDLDALKRINDFGWLEARFRSLDE